MYFSWFPVFLFTTRFIVLFSSWFFIFTIWTTGIKVLKMFACSCSRLFTDSTGYRASSEFAPLGPLRTWLVCVAWLSIFGISFAFSITYSGPRFCSFIAFGGTFSPFFPNSPLVSFASLLAGSGKISTKSNNYNFTFVNLKNVAMIPSIPVHYIFRRFLQSRRSFLNSRRDGCENVRKFENSSLCHHRMLPNKLLIRSTGSIGDKDARCISVFQNFCLDSRYQRTL